MNGTLADYTAQIHIGKAPIFRATRIVKSRKKAAPPVPLDVGSGATDRAHMDDIVGAVSGYSYIDKNNPLNADGTITTVKLFLRNVSATGLYVGLFFNTGVNKYKCRSAQLIGNVPKDSIQTFPVILAGIMGDLIGLYGGTSPWTMIEDDWAGGIGIGGVYTKNTCVVGDESTYNNINGYMISLEGSG